MLGQFDRLRRLFADQFDQDRAGIVYRRSLKGPPIPVSEAERDAYIAAFNRTMRHLGWSMIPVVVAFIVGLALLVPDQNSLTAGIALYGGVAIIITVFSGLTYRALHAPERALHGRPVKGVAREREELRRLGFARMTYKQLGLTALVVAAAVWNVSFRQDVRHGWGMLWLVLAGAAILVTGVQAIRKWLYESA